MLAASQFRPALIAVVTIKSRTHIIFECWQGSYPAAYRDAYMAVSAPAIFAPFVRLELLHWDPLFGADGGGAAPLCLL